MTVLGDKIEQLKGEKAASEPAEEQQRQSQEILQLVIDNIPQFIFWKDRNSVFLGCNRNFAQVAGVGTSENIIGKTDYDLPWKKEESDLFRECDVRVMETDTPEYHIIESQLQADGKHAWVEVNKIPLHDQEGNVVGILGTYEDITDRQQAEASLRASVRVSESVAVELRALFAAMTDLIFVLDAQGRYLKIAPTNPALLYKPAEDLVGKRLDEIFAPAPTEFFLDYIGRALDTQQTIDVEYSLCIHGTQMWFAARVSPLQDDTVIWVARDITERKQAEELLRESEARLRVALHAANMGVWDWEIATGKVTWSDKVESLFGLAPGSFAGSYEAFLHCVYPEDRNVVNQVVQSAITAGTGYEVEHRILKPDGTIRWVGGKADLLRDENGRVVRLTGVVMDISDRKQAEEELRHSQERLQSFFEATFEGVVIHEGDKILDVNPAAEAMYGYSTKEMIGQSVQEIIATNSHEVLEGESCLSCDRPYEAIGQKKDGTTFVTQLSSKNIVYRGQRARVVGIRDITLAKLAQQELRESELRHSLLIQQTSLAVIEWNLNLEVTQWNPAAEAIFGYSKSEIVGVHAIDIIVPESAREHVNKVFNDLLTHQNVIHNINENLTKDGRTIICEWYNTVLVDQNGNTIGIATLALNITKRKRAEEALRQSEAQLRQQATQLELALYELQQTQTQLIQTEKMSSLGQMLAGIAHEINNPITFIYSNLQYAQNYIQDLLNLVHLYQQQYPQPTPTIQAHTEEIDLEFLMDDLPKLLSSMNMGTDRILKLVSSLRNYSRLDAGEMKQVDLHSGIDDTLLLLNHRVKGAIAIIKHYGELPLVECHPAPLNQVFMNLLSNAIDALLERTEQADKQIVIQTQAVVPNQINVRIRDNGLGIPLEIKDKIFDPFFTTKDVGKGTGLGLWICYEIIEKHQGQIAVNSQLGQGTEFVITLPVKQSLSLAA